MYHAVKIDSIDQHTHRCLWRNMETEREPDVYVITSVSFGDKPAGNIATLALRKAAEMGKETYPKAASIIQNSTYVDGIIDSVDSLTEAKELTEDIDKLLQPGGFEIKHWTIHSEGESLKSIHESDASLSTGTPESSCNDAKGDKQNNFQQIGTKSLNQKVLGVGWNPKTDSFHFSVRINFSPRRKKIRTGPSLNINQVTSEIPIALTKRMVLSQVNGMYGPLGLATPFTAKAKIL